MSPHIGHPILTTNLRDEEKVNLQVRLYFFMSLPNTYVRPTYVSEVFLGNLQILMHSIILSTKLIVNTITTPILQMGKLRLRV